MFAMKHHYYNNPKPGTNELYNSRDIIVGDNPVVSIFNNNNYKTSLILEKSYLLVNRPKIRYDFCNISYSEIGYLDRGFEVNRNVIEDLQQGIIKISLRSKGDFSVNKMSREHFHGGGHTNAAGGKSDDNIEKTIEKFISILPQYNTLLNEA